MILRRTPLSKFSVIRFGEGKTTHLNFTFLSLRQRDSGISYVRERVYITENILKGIFTMFNYGDDKILI